MDKDGYPQDNEIKFLTEIPTSDFKNNAIEILRLFETTGYGGGKVFDNKDGTVSLELYTGGWSGCEDMIGALAENKIWWLMFWQESKRGGHFLFSANKDFA